MPDLTIDFGQGHKSEKRVHPAKDHAARDHAARDYSSSEHGSIDHSDRGHKVKGHTVADHIGRKHISRDFSAGQGADHGGRNHGQEFVHKPKKDKAEGKIETGLGSWGHHSSSSQAIAAAAEHSVGHSTYLPRKGSEYYGQHLPKNLGCTSASTNMFFDGLKAAGKVSDKDYRRLHQVGNDAAYSSMQRLGIAHPVNGHDLKPGDWAYFSSPHRKHGHSGVVFEGKNGQLMVANNHSGTTIATPLSTMMRKYDRVRGLRATL